MKTITDFFTLHSTLAPSLLVTFIYTAIGLMRGKIRDKDFLQVVAVFASAGAVIAGIRLATLILSPESKLPDIPNLDESLTASALIGSFALIWIGFSECAKRFRDLFI